MTTQSLVIKKVRVLDPVSGSDRFSDFWLEDGIIKAIAPNITDFPTETPTLEGQGLILGPGLVDLYSHSGEPGHEERETLQSLLGAASAGGFTRVSILGDTKPPLDNLDIVASLKQKTLNTTTKLQFWGSLTLGAKGEQMTELVELASGVIGFADGKPLENLTLLYRLLEYLKPLNKPVALFPSSTQLKGNGVMREGPASLRFGLPGNPAISETTALTTLLELVAQTKTPVHLMRISTARGVELIAQAKARGLPVTASTTWLHLLVDTEAIALYDTSLRLEPPLGNTGDVEALIEGVKTGVIDGIAVDHQAYTYEEKTLAFAEAPPGAIGLELALPLLWQRFVASGEWTALELWSRMSLGPLKCLQDEPISVIEGAKAELTLFDPNQMWTVDRANLNSICHNTSWLGKQLTGRVVQIWN